MGDSDPATTSAGETDDDGSERRFTLGESNLTRADSRALLRALTGRESDCTPADVSADIDDLVTLYDGVLTMLAAFAEVGDLPEDLTADTRRDFGQSKSLLRKTVGDLEETTAERLANADAEPDAGTNGPDTAEG